MIATINNDNNGDSRNEKNNCGSGDFRGISCLSNPGHSLITDFYNLSSRGD